MDPMYQYASCNIKCWYLYKEAYVHGFQIGGEWFYAKGFRKNQEISLLEHDWSVRSILRFVHPRGTGYVQVADIREKIDSGYTYLAHRSYSDAVSLIGGVMSRKGIELPELKKDPMKALFGRENVRIVWFLIKTAPLHFPFPFSNHPYLRIRPWFLYDDDRSIPFVLSVEWIGSVTEIKEKNGVRNESESRPSTESMVRSSSLLTATCLIVKGVRKKAHFSNWDPISREIFANIAADIVEKDVIFARSPPPFRVQQPIFCDDMRACAIGGSSGKWDDLRISVIRWRDKMTGQNR